MERADVVVVGGGPAGSSVALGLRGSGRHVVVLDRARFPRDKTCAGWVTPQTFESLGVEPADYAKGHVLQEIRGFAVERQGDRGARARFERVVSYGIRRCEFDAHLLARCGAEVREGVGLRSLERGGAGWVVNGRITAPLVVGAGGHFCPVGRRLATGPRAAEPIVAAQEFEVALDERQARDCPVDPEMPEIFFTPDLRGYGWIFRKGRFLNVGLGRQDKRGLAGHLRSFLAELKRRGRLPADLDAGAAGHAYLLYDQAPRRLVGEGLALVGDAAGLAYPRSGEGIRPAVESGLLLARAQLEASSEGALAGYEAALLDRLGSRVHRPGPTDWLPPGLVRFLAGRLFGNAWFAREVVVRRWFVHDALPALPPAESMPDAAAPPFDRQPTLRGEIVTLRPLVPADFDGLYAAAADPLIWEQHPVNDRHERTGFQAYFRDALASGGALVALDTRTQKVIGASRFHGYDREASEVEIGWSFLARSHWGGVANGEMKRLMLEHAFRFVDRVVLLVSPANLRSQRAAQKVGAVRMGSRPDASGNERFVYLIERGVRGPLAPGKS